jgi:hypothetical protein
MPPDPADCTPRAPTVKAPFGGHALTAGATGLFFSIKPGGMFRRQNRESGT